MPYHLVVTNPFANRNVGERIKDKDEVAGVLSSHNAAHVVKVWVEDEPKQELSGSMMLRVPSKTDK